MTNQLSMAAFALAASISPGPVNIVALGAGAQRGLGASLRHVGGATAGFTLLLLLTGFGLHEVTRQFPGLIATIRWAGVVFLLYLAWKLACDDGVLRPDAAGNAPSFWSGAAMQWLNPKAWMAAVAGTGVFAAGGDAARVAEFAAIYCLVCYPSIACWAWAGAALHGSLNDAARVRTFNRAMALLLAANAAWLLVN